MRDIDVLGNKVTDLTPAELLDEIDRTIRDDDFEIVLNTNVHGILLSQRLPWLKAFRNSVRITHCDGGGVVLAARMLGHAMGPRVSLNDFFWEFATHCEQHGHALFLLGGREDVLARAADAIYLRCPQLRIAGMHHGYFAKQGAETDAVIERINASGAHVLMVGFGMPLQERWIRDHGARLHVNVVWAVGGLFDLISGNLATAPRWVRAHALEWAWLSLQRPGRFFSRYLLENPEFLTQVLAERLRNRRRPLH
jgi:N-acetylglucosaminyldiphosphoundecaprenol N-acetyl-beta-D-mannosaminyltransferase